MERTQNLTITFTCNTARETMVVPNQLVGKHDEPESGSESDDSDGSSSEGSANSDESYIDKDAVAEIAADNAYFAAFFRKEISAHTDDEFVADNASWYGVSRGNTGCRRKHALKKFDTTTPLYNCNVCHRKGLPVGTTMHGCRICNWDACSECSKTLVL